MAIFHKCICLLGLFVVLMVAESSPSYSGSAETLQEMEKEFAAVEATLNAGQYDEALPKLAMLARKGNPKAQLALALLYFEGRGIEKSIDQAFAWSWCSQATFEYYNYQHAERQAKNFAFHISTNFLTEDAAVIVISNTVEKWNWCHEPFRTDAGVIERVTKDRICKNCDFRGLRIPDIDWSGVDLSGSDLSFIDTHFGFNLNSANLSGAQLVSANLDNAIMSGASLAGAQLWLVKLRGANLKGADLSSADLSDALLIDADLADAKLAGTKLTNAIFCNTTMPDGALNNTGCRRRDLNFAAAAIAFVAQSGYHNEGALIHIFRSPRYGVFSRLGAPRNMPGVEGKLTDCAQNVR